MTVDLVVIGLGAAGRSAAELANELGASVVAIDRARPGGDCLWTGCVPSKSLLAAARTAHAMRTADRFGITPAAVEVDFSVLWQRIGAVQDSIASSDDDPDRLRAAGIDVVLGEARLAGPTTVVVGDRTIETRFILVATGSTPVLPDIDGLDGVGALTTNTLWARPKPPDSLLIIGGGPIGVELAQGFHRLGLDVEVLEASETILGDHDPTLAGQLHDVLEDEGVRIVPGAHIEHVGRRGDRAQITATVSGAPRVWEAADVLVATGRTPVVDRIGLVEVGVELGEHGVVVDSAGRTSVASIYAAGDVAGRPNLTHWAASAGTVAVRDMFLPGRAAVETVIPRCTFTDPEFASVGLTVHDAQHQHANVEEWHLDLSETDRGRTDGAVGGIVLVTAGRQLLVGAHILGPGAGEAIGELTLAIRDGRRLNHLAGLLHAYPTISSGIGTLAARAVRAKAARVGAAAARRAERGRSPRQG